MMSIKCNVIITWAIAFLINYEHFNLTIARTQGYVKRILTLEDILSMAKG